MANSRSSRSQQSCLFLGRGSLGLANGKIFPESKKILLFLTWDFHFLFSLKLVWILKLTWARKVLVVVVPYRLSLLLQRNKRIKQERLFAFLSYFPSRPDLLLTDSHLSATCGTCERPLYQVRQKIDKKVMIRKKGERKKSNDHEKISQKISRKVIMIKRSATCTTSWSPTWTSTRLLWTSRGTSARSLEPALSLSSKWEDLGKETIWSQQRST